MSTTITMPQLGESVAEGTVGRWLKQEGETIKRDESLVEIITDKVTAELPSPVAGRVSKILVAADQTVKVGTPIAEIEDGSASGGSASGAGAGTSGTSSAPSSTSSAAGNAGGTGGAAPSAFASSPTPTPAPSFAAPTMPAPTSAPSSSASGSGSAVAVAATPNGTASYGGNGDYASTANGYDAGARERGERISPLARRMAQEHNVDLARIQGTGEGGRVRKEDILAYVEQRDRATAPRMAAVATPPPPPVLAPQPASVTPITPPPDATAAAAPPPAPAAPPVTAAEGDQIVTPTPMRRVIAEHMVRSKRTSPHATTLVEVDMTGLTRWLDHNREDFKRREGYGISYVPFVVKATVEALKEFPYLNSSWTEDNKIILRKQIHIGVSISVDNGLIVPVIRNADTLSIAGLARAVSDLATRARTNRLQPSEVQGATFTVNNPGVFGTILSVAVINQPNAGILTMDAVVKRPVVIDDAIAIRSMMYLGISFDHRLVDGSIAAGFLASIRKRLESWGPGTEVF